MKKKALKYARSVFLYPYIRSQILQYVKYTTLINIAKEIANLFDKYVRVFGQNVKTQEQQNKITNIKYQIKYHIKIKTLAGAGHWTWVLSHPKRMRYIYTTESTENIVCSQVI